MCELITNSRDMNNNNSRKSWEQDVEDDLFKVVNNFITWASCSTFEFFKGPKLGVWFESFDSTIQLLIVSLRQAAARLPKVSVFLWCQDWCSLASLSSEKNCLIPKINCLLILTKNKLTCISESTWPILMQNHNLIWMFFREKIVKN